VVCEEHDGIWHHLTSFKHQDGHVTYTYVRYKPRVGVK
jgi:hypothetical protein